MSLDSITPEEAVEWYLADRESELAEASLRSHKSRLGHFLRWCDEVDTTDLNELSGRDLHRYRLWRREDGELATVTEKTEMDTVRVFIRWCESIDAVEQDLSTKVLSPTLSNGENVRDEMLDADVAERILEYLSTFEYASDRHVCLRLLWRALLRRGALRALDLEDYDPDEQSLEVIHRPDTGTPVKNQYRGERFLALSPETCTVLDDWIETRRPDVTDEYGRAPLLATKQGRMHVGTIQSIIYSVTRPCFTTNDCPHGREIEGCDAAADQTQAYECPSSVSPHPVRRGALTHWLRSEVPEHVISDRGNVTSDVLKKHYDERSEQEKMEQRRRYLDNI